MPEESVRLGLAVVASPLEVGAGEAPALLARLHAAMEGISPPRLELVVWPRPVTTPDEAMAAGRRFYDARIDAVGILAASWFEDYLVLDLLEECPVPVIAWARPGMETGSLCGMQQLGYMLRELGHSSRFLFDEPGSTSASQQVWRWALAAAVRRRLRRARVGHLGHRVEGMTETTVYELALKRLLGARIVAIDAPQFLARTAAISDGQVAERWAQLKSRVGRVAVPDGAGLESLRAYLALREAIERDGLAAVAIGCYPHLMGVVCLAASLLGEEGIPIGCEGDVNGVVAMLILALVSGTPVHNTDLLDPIAAHNSIVFSHCGSGGFSLACSADEIALSPVRLMDRGVCCLFTARPGPCTLLNLVPTRGSYRLGILYGEALPTTMVFPGNPLEVRFRSPYGQVLEWIAANGLGHHWMAAYGDLRSVLADLCSMTGLETLSLD